MSDTITATTAEKRRRLEAELELVRVIEDATAGMDLDEIDGIFPCRWRYAEPYQLRDEPAEVRRAAALAWLARHAKAVTAVAKACGVDQVAKVASDRDFGVRADLSGYPAWLSAEAFVPAQLTCEMRPTGETTVIPAQPAREEQVMERVCPPSIFQGIEQEVVA